MRRRGKILLDKGYFPSQLPPQFTTASLGLAIDRVEKAWEKLAADSRWYKPELFSVIRNGHRRRTTSVMNPLTQVLLADSIDRYWTHISKTFRSSLGVSAPKIDGTGQRSTPMFPMQDLYERKISRSGGYKYILRTDIARFFPTIYTHAIPWAIHGKSAAKKNSRKLTPAFFGNILDKAIRDGQDGQTIGIPIGPDTSHIIAEIVVSAVDREFVSRLGKKPEGFRYVDDYFLFFESQREAEQALAELSVAMQAYQLELNFDKTRVISVDAISDDFWTQKLRTSSISTDAGKQRSDLNHFFDYALDLARQNPNDSVMKYALRRASSVLVRKENWELFEAHLCRVGFAHPNTLQIIAALLSTYYRYCYPISKKALSRFCNSLILDGAPLNHHSEVAWALYICGDLELRVSAAAMDALAEIHSSICILLALNLERRKLTSRRLNRRKLKPLMSTEALMGDLWLVAYEAGVRKWIQADDSFVSAHPRFKVLNDSGVRFFDETRSVALVFAPRKELVEGLPIESEAELFDMAEDVTRYLRFEEPSAEYQDVALPEEFQRNTGDF